MSNINVLFAIYWRCTRTVSEAINALGEHYVQCLKCGSTRLMFLRSISIVGFCSLESQNTLCSSWLVFPQYLSIDYCQITVCLVASVWRAWLRRNLLLWICCLLLQIVQPVDVRRCLEVPYYCSILYSVSDSFASCLKKSLND